MFVTFRGADFWKQVGWPRKIGDGGSFVLPLYFIPFCEVI